MKLAFSKILLALITFTFFLLSSAKASEINEENILRLINTERSKRGIKELRIDAALSGAAHLKSRDMINRNYFEHYAYGLAPWDFMTNAGYSYQIGGENLAMNFMTGEGTMKALMNSPSHRDNILNPDFEDLGIGVVKGTFHEANKEHSTIMLTTMFGKKRSIFVNLFYSLKKVMPLY